MAEILSNTPGSRGQAGSRGRSDGRDRLTTLPLGRRPTTGTGAYSRFVGFLKLVLPAVAVGLVLLLVVWPQVSLDDRFRVEPVRFSLEDVTGLRMVNPRFYGFDARDQPFTVTADGATQTVGAQRVVNLEQPKADMGMRDGAWVAMTARSGVYDENAQLLQLNADIELFHDTGHRFATDRAIADLAAGTAMGNNPVAGHGPAGDLWSDGFRLLEGGDRLIFTGRARMVMFPAGSADDGADLSPRPGELPGPPPVFPDAEAPAP